MDATVDIVVLNWNRPEDTLSCVASLERQTFPYRKVIVIDNGSTGGIPEELSALHTRDRLQVQALPENLGYTGGNNLAMQAAFASGADYVWLFNNDAQAQPDALSKLVAVAEADTRVGLASPLLYEEDRPTELQFGCGVLNLPEPGYTAIFDKDQVRQSLIDHPDRIVLYGTALLVSKGLFAAIGGFDDQFFAYFEDVDYSMRSCLAGFWNVVALDATVHHESKSTRAAPEAIKPHYYYLHTRNELLAWRKYYHGRRYARLVVWALVRHLAQIRRMPGYTAGIDALLAGVWHGWRGTGGRFNRSDRMPFPLRMALSRFPGFWLRVLGAKTEVPPGAEPSRHP